MSNVKFSSAPTMVDVCQHLLAICIELVSKNKVIKLDRLYNIARRELQVESTVILKGIKRLEDDLIIKADSKLLRSGLLQNDTRREIYAIIKRNPGISFNQIRSQMGKGTKLVLWHLEVLSDFGCIRSYVFELNAKAYFSRHVDEAEWGRDGLYMLQLYQNANVKKILDMLSDGGSYTIKQFEQRLGISRQLVEYHLKKLQDKHVVDVVDREPRLYFIVEMQRRLFLKCKDYFASQAMV